MIDVLEKNPNIGILSARLVTPKGELQTEGNFFSYKTSLLGAVYPSLLDKQQSKKISENRVGKLNIIDWMTGAALMLRKDIVISVKMYDEDYFMYSEEVDLAYRVKQSGYKVACMNDYEIIHFGNVTASHFNDWRRNLMARNILLYFFKNFHGQKLALSLFNFVLSTLMRFVISIIRLDELEWKIAISQIKAFQYVNEPAKRPD
jgi:GT2 family glycosyltransferase